MPTGHPKNPRTKSARSYALGDPLPHGEADSGRLHPKGRGKGEFQDLIAQQGGTDPPIGTYGHVYTWTDSSGRLHQSYSAKRYAVYLRKRDNVGPGVNTGFYPGP